MTRNYTIQEVITKFAIKNIKYNYQTTYRIIKDTDGNYRIEDYLTNIREWTNTYSPIVRWTSLDALWNSVEFKNLFINNI